MKTTAFYVEQIVIGLETSIWIIAFITYFSDLTFLSTFKSVIEKLPASIISLGILYTLGMIVDRIADVLLENVENKARQASNLEAKSSIVIWKNENERDYSKYIRHRIRILRSSIINLPLITISLVLIIAKHTQSTVSLILFVIFIGVILSVSSFYGYKRSVFSFYNKARILECIKEQQDENIAE